LTSSPPSEMARKLYIDTESGRFVEGLESTIPADLNAFFQGDSASYELYFVRRATSGTYEPQDLSAASVKLHIGPPPPSTATAYVAQNSWSNLPTTVSATATRVVTGGPSANEQQVIALSPEAHLGTFALTFPARTIALTGSVAAGVFTSSGSHGLTLNEPFSITGFEGASGGLSSGQSLFVSQIINATQFTASITRGFRPGVTAFTAITAGSVVTVTASTRLIAARATAAQAQAAIEAVPSVGIGNTTINGLPGKEYRLGYQGDKGQVALPVPTIASALTPIYGKSATLNFNTNELNTAISGSATLDAVLEVEITQSGNVETVAQIPIMLRNDIITGTSPLPVSTTTAAFFNLLSPNNTVWAVSVDDNGVLTTENIT
jgi:hypothetical protein